jgi:NAD(P)H-flavin reductase
MKSDNPLIPRLAKVVRIVPETADIRTFVLEVEGEPLRHLPGQFVELSAFGAGEAPFCVASSPTRGGAIECSVKRMGTVTQALHRLLPGSTIGVRGPFGNHFPLEEMEGAGLLFVGGGIGMAPLRPAIQFCLDQREKYGAVEILYGARTADDLVYKKELEEWAKAPRTNVTLTVDPGGEKAGWAGKVGLVPRVLEEMKPRADFVITCGPPIMIKFTLLALSRLGFAPEKVYTTLEMKMTCGIGKCGRCNIGRYYICKDGPVFSLKTLQEIGGAAG